MAIPEKVDEIIAASGNKQDTEKYLYSIRNYLKEGLAVDPAYKELDAKYHEDMIVKIDEIFENAKAACDDIVKACYVSTYSEEEINYLSSVWSHPIGKSALSKGVIVSQKFQVELSGLYNEFIEPKITKVLVLAEKKLKKDKVGAKK